MNEAMIWLRPNADRGALDELAAELGWTLHADDERAHAMAASRAWIVPGTGGEEPVTVGWSENHVLGVRMAWAPHGELEARVRALLPHFTRDELLAAAAASPVEALPALRVLTLMERQELTEPLRALFSRWMRYEGDDEVPLPRLLRQAVLNLCWIGRWPALLPLIEERAAQDAELGQAWQQLADVMTGRTQAKADP